MTKEEKRTEIFNSGRAWIVACVAIIASILISVNCNKLPATMSLVIPALGIDTGMAANIMSLNGYVGLIMTFVGRRHHHEVRSAQGHDTRIGMLQ